jgi:hypothetical protein
MQIGQGAMLESTAHGTSSPRRALLRLRRCVCLDVGDASKMQRSATDPMLWKFGHRKLASD